RVNKKKYSLIKISAPQTTPPAPLPTLRGAQIPHLAPQLRRRGQKPSGRLVSGQPGAPGSPLADVWLTSHQPLLKGFYLA
ncbi:hypothetical protein, partial [Collinsella sp. HCP28S3_H5]|uniref:hypothetical protein n=1 Tax=Collinsella sp. HCP28S3_H5 TaxID=3438928 RepID=UPI003F8866CC